LFKGNELFEFSIIFEKAYLRVNGTSFSFIINDRKLNNISNLTTTFPTSSITHITVSK